MSPEVMELINDGCVPGGSHKNLDHAAPHTHFSSSVTDAQKLVFADAQTSGGLLLSVPAGNLDAVMDILGEADAPCATVIGHTTERRSHAVYVHSA